jgi:hypothetical protein
MNFKPLTQFLSNNQKEIIAGVFLLLSVSMCKEAPTPVVNNYNYSPTYNTEYVAPIAPPVAPEHKAPRPRKLARKKHRKPVAKPQPQPSCPCADSTKAGV